MPLTRRQLLTIIGLAGGTAAMFRAMEALGQVGETSFAGPPDLSGTPKANKVLILGAGLAGLVAAYELEKAGYQVSVLEYQNRTGGRNWTLRTGDTVTELGGATQQVQFAPGNYFNPGPWRIPARHRGLLHYCRELGVILESFIQANGEALVHSRTAYQGKPRRYREVSSDFIGRISELLAKAADAHLLDQQISTEDRERLLHALRGWGRLDEKLAYGSTLRSSARRGYDRWPGAGVDGAPTPSPVADLHDVLDPMTWRVMDFFLEAEMQPTMFQPVGGMDMIGRAFAKKVSSKITLNARVMKVAQDASGVKVSYEDLAGGKIHEVKADWCICTLPLQVVSQIEIQVSDGMQAAVRAIPYAPHVKIGLEFRRRFWEEDDAIYGGTTFTDQPITVISYPNDRFHAPGPAVLLGAYPLDMAAFELGGMSPEERIEAALAQGELIHPQYRKEFLNGVSVAWSRVPWILGCRAIWSEETRKLHYKNLTALDGRIVLAGDHCSYLQGWQEGAITSALDAIGRLHQRASSMPA